MKLFLVTILLICSSASAQIVDLEHPKSLFVPDIKLSPYKELLYDLKCPIPAIFPACLHLKENDTLLIFYEHELMYQSTEIYGYFKRGNSIFGTIYMDKGFTDTIKSKATGGTWLEWRPGNLQKFSTNIPDSLTFDIKTLLIELDKPELRMLDTTINITHDPNLYFFLFIGEQIYCRAAHKSQTGESEMIRKIKHHRRLLYKNFIIGN